MVITKLKVEMEIINKRNFGKTKAVSFCFINLFRL